MQTQTLQAPHVAFSRHKFREANPTFPPNAVSSGLQCELCRQSQGDAVTRTRREIESSSRAPAEREICCTKSLPWAEAQKWELALVANPWHHTLLPCWSSSVPVTQKLGWPNFQTSMAQKDQGPVGYSPGLEALVQAVNFRPLCEGQN